MEDSDGGDVDTHITASQLMHMFADFEERMTRKLSCEMSRHVVLLLRDRCTYLGAALDLALGFGVDTPVLDHQDSEEVFVTSALGAVLNDIGSIVPGLVEVEETAHVRSIHGNASTSKVNVSCDFKGSWLSKPKPRVPGDTIGVWQKAEKFPTGRSLLHSRTSGEVLNVLGQLINLLQKGRSNLLVPRKKTIDELMSSRNMKSLTPPLPGDLAVSFYLQAHKLVLAVYHLSNAAGTMKFESVQAECSVPWLSPVLVCFTTALHLAHQLRDKISVFSQYKDFTPDSCSVSTVCC
ncbi:unnamed protein product, partial [Meganyctiphanes norvegica]